MSVKAPAVTPEYNRNMGYAYEVNSYPGRYIVLHFAIAIVSTEEIAKVGN